MAGNLKKFINPRFIKTIDLRLMNTLLARHKDKLNDFDLSVLNEEEPDAREALGEFLTGSEENYPEGLRADLHRVAELGDKSGLEIIQAQADRHGVDLFPELKVGDEEEPNKAHDPKHLALRVFLEHPDLFDAAADQRAMMAADRLQEFAGKERGVAVDLSDDRMKRFEAAIRDLFCEAFQGDYCRVGEYVDDGEINLVIAHGSVVSTMPVVEGQEERVISVRQIKHAVIRYSETTGMLGLARIRKAHQAEIAEIFASEILEKPGFFDGDDARDLYTLSPIEEAGPTFNFDHRYDPVIDRVEITEAAADLMIPGKGGYLRAARSFRSRDPGGEALKHLAETPADFGGSWRLGELVFRVVFKSDAKRQPQVTVKLRPPSVLQFRRTQHEARILTLIERHGLRNERENLSLIEAAE